MKKSWFVCFNTSVAMTLGCGNWTISLNTSSNPTSSAQRFEMARRQPVVGQTSQAQNNFLTNLYHSVTSGNTRKFSFPIKTFKSLCLLFFIKFLFFHKMIALQKLWKMFFISPKKLFSFARYSSFCNFFPSFPCFSDPKGQMEEQ